jgi:hypothetical protein
VRRLAVVCVAVVLVLLAAAQAAAASGWAVESVPTPAMLDGQLSAVSCTGDSQDSLA